MPFHAIVLAGGSGSRLAALTERLAGRPMPKQFCRLGTPRTLVQETVARLSPLIPPGRTVVVVRDAHRAFAETQLGSFPGLELLAQPSDRGTMPAVALALRHVLARDPAALVLITPSDHGVRDRAAYVRGVARARDAAAEGAAPIVLLGVEADAAHGDFGWIVPGAEVVPGVRRVESFVEKPGPEGAAVLLERRALLSTMVLVARASALFDHMVRERPGLAALLAMLATLPQEVRALHLRRAYDAMPVCDFSREILGTAKELAVVKWPTSIGWTDLGTPDRVAAWAGRALAPALAN